MTRPASLVVAVGGSVLPAEEVAAATALVADYCGGPAAVVNAADAAGIAAAYEPGRTVAFFTSGSTGHPTCVIAAGPVLLRHAEVIASALELQSQPRWLALPPPGYAYGLSIVASHRVAGVPVVFLSTGTSATSVASVAEEGGPVGLYLLPQQVPLALALGLSPDAVRRVVVAGGRVTATAVAALAQHFPRADLTNMYGQAELGPRISMRRSAFADFREGDVGHPLPGVSVRIADSDEAGVGRVLVRSQYAATAVAPHPYTSLVRPADEVDTGDLGRIGADGRIIHHGRGDHVINVAGTKLDAAALLGAIQARLAPLAVRIGSRDTAVLGDRVPVVEIVPAPGTALTARDVRRALHPLCGPLTALLDVRIVERLTTGESGK